MATLLAVSPVKENGAEQDPDVENRLDTRPLLPKERTIAFYKAGRCKDVIGSLFWKDDNPQFADDAELAVRAAFFVVVVGLPFLTPRNSWPTLDWVMDKGMYTNGVVLFFIYNLYKTTGETVLNVVCGLRGTLLAVLNTWMISFFFPGGVTQDSPDYVWWAGVINGVIFILAMLWLNWEMSTMIFAVSNFVFFWMAFLHPGKDDFYCPFTKDFDFVGNVGVNSLLTVGAGGVLCIMVTLFPYPRLALNNAKDTADELTHEVPKIWKTLAEYYTQQKPNTYLADKLYRRLTRLAKISRTMEANIENSWYECWCLPRRHHVRRVLNRLSQIIRENYDRLYSTSSMIVDQENWDVMHTRLMNVVEPSMVHMINETEVLLCLCLRSAYDGVLSEVEGKALEKMCVSVQQAEMGFSTAFTGAREELLMEPETANGHDKSNKFRVGMEDLLDEHMFVLNLSSFSRLTVGFAQDLIELRKNPHHLPKVRELPSLSSLWDPSTITDPMHLNWALRASMVIFTGFAIGYNGSGLLFRRFDASIACTASVLLSKFIGSAMVKNLGRVQGVVLGSVIGQIGRSFFNSCEWVDVGMLALCIFAFSTVSLFTYYNSSQYSYIACLLAAFGAGQMLEGRCSTQQLDKAGSYGSIITTITAITLLVLFDLIFPPGRASKMAHDALDKSFGSLQTALADHFDNTVPHVRFHKGDLMSAIDESESLGEEASNEPRYWRTPWKQSLFTRAVANLYRVRYSLAAMEYSMAENFQDGGKKNRMLMEMLATPGFVRLSKLVGEKLAAVRPLVGFFAHESVLPFAAFNDPGSLTEYHSNVKDVQRQFVTDLSKSRTFEEPKYGLGAYTSLELDPLCQVASVLGSLHTMIKEIRRYQHNMLQGE